MLFPHDLPDADVQHRQAWLSPAEADALQRDLQAGVPWEVHRIRMFGHWVDSPRLSCWIGDPQARYRYSGAEFVPHPWPPSLQGMRERLQDDGLGRFNSVLLNRYRSGGDYMGWHSDDEPELGAEPTIASLSFGATRSFILRHKRNKRTCKLDLHDGSLLLMSGSLQSNWLHGINKAARSLGERINLTFRFIA